MQLVTSEMKFGDVKTIRTSGVGPGLGTQVPVGPPWGLKVPLKVRNTRLGHKSTLSEKFRGIMKIGIRFFLVTNLEHVCPGLLAPI